MLKLSMFGDEVQPAYFAKKYGVTVKELKSFLRAQGYVKRGSSYYSPELLKDLPNVVVKVFYTPRSVLASLSGNGWYQSGEDNYRKARIDKKDLKPIVTIEDIEKYADLYKITPKQVKHSLSAWSYRRHKGAFYAKADDLQEARKREPTKSTVSIKDPTMEQKKALLKRGWYWNGYVLSPAKIPKSKIPDRLTYAEFDVLRKELKCTRTSLEHSLYAWSYSFKSGVWTYCPDSKRYLRD